MHVPKANDEPGRGVWSGAMLCEHLALIGLVLRVNQPPTAVPAVAPLLEFVPIHRHPMHRPQGFQYSQPSISSSFGIDRTVAEFSPHIRE